MKRLLSFAAAAATVLFAACQKTEVVYDNPDPQEIALFAVNKVATKAPVSGTLYPVDYDMQVAAYLSAGGISAGDYFDNTTFTKKDAGSTWAGGKYWPLTSSTLNFLAVTNPKTVGDYTGTVSTVQFGESSGSPAVYSNFAKKAVVTLTDNQTTASKFNQFDLMFAAGLQSNVITTSGSSTYNNVGLQFTHALSWINFAVNKNDVAAKITVNSIRLNGASYGGTLTLTNANYSSPTTSVTTDVTPVWNPVSAKVDNVYVPNGSADTGSGLADKKTTANALATEVVLGTGDPVSFGNGLLVVPGEYAANALSFTINYTIDQDGNDGTTSDVNTFEYTYKLPVTTWTYSNKYTYNITIKLTEIEVAPTTSGWTTPAGTDVPLV